MKKEHSNPDNGELVYSIDTEKLKGKYYSAENSGIWKLSKEIELEGFKSLPKGLSTKGYGFASPAGTFLTNFLSETFGEGNRLRIAKNIPSKVKKYESVFHITLNHADYLRILDTLREIRKEKNIKSNGHVANVLGEIYPKYFDDADSVETIYTYEDDKITKILGDESVFEQLSKADIETIANIYSKIAEESEVSFSSIGIAKESKDRNERVYLESVISEFENRLGNSRLSESDWQRFLQQYILLFNTSYVHTIEKLSVDIRGKYPDFILVNVYGYLDVYEIKKPSTNLLKHDSSRNNYYWDSEISKAIIQTEQYIQMLIKKAADVREIIEEKHGIDVKVVRPRGYIVVGNSEQFADKRMEDDFRLLASSLKNVDIILYDELMNNLKNLLGRLS